VITQNRRGPPRFVAANGRKAVFPTLAFVGRQIEGVQGGVALPSVGQVRDRDRFPGKDVAVQAAAAAQRLVVHVWREHQDSGTGGTIQGRGNELRFYPQ
jgi:hypothetical protein